MCAPAGRHTKSVQQGFPLVSLTDRNISSHLSIKSSLTHKNCPSGRPAFLHRRFQTESMWVPFFGSTGFTRLTKSFNLKTSQNFLFWLQRQNFTWWFPELSSVVLLIYTPVKKNRFIRFESGRENLHQYTFPHFQVLELKKMCSLTFSHTQHKQCYSMDTNEDYLKLNHTRLHWLHLFRIAVRLGNFSWLRNMTDCMMSSGKPPICSGVTGAGSTLLHTAVTTTYLTKPKSYPAINTSQRRHKSVGLVTLLSLWRS